MAVAFTGCGKPSYLTIKKLGNGGKTVTVNWKKKDKVSAKVVIPKGVTEINDGTFSGCESLASVTFQGTKAQWRAMRKGYNGFIIGTFSVKCTDGELLSQRWYEP